MQIFVLNAGSSSIKYSLFDSSEHTLLVRGEVSRIGEASLCDHVVAIRHNSPQLSKVQCTDHEQAYTLIYDVIFSKNTVDVIGHRVVHGGTLFSDVTLLTPDNVAQLQQLNSLAPLHNPINLLGIEIAMARFPDRQQYAVFDTAMFKTIPEYAYRYALPKEISQQLGIRRYGFHGISHSYVAKRIARELNLPLNDLSVISLHLGNGSSATAVSQGQAIETSMGMTPLEGLMMGSRSGDIDPGVLLYLLRNGYTEAMLDDMLNKQSGLKGICGMNDMRSIRMSAEKGDTDSSLALEMYVYRIKKYIGAYFAILHNVNAVIFTGGIGFYDARLREEICLNMEKFGIHLDKEKNRQTIQGLAQVASDTSAIKIYVVETDEELEIATQVSKCIVSES